jgi:hypothetical protein
VATKRTSVVLNALQVTFKNIDAMPVSPEVDALRLRALACEAEAKRWPTSMPSAMQREAMMQRVLQIHIALAKIARETTASK